MILKSTITCLNCGHNGTGLSSLLTIENNNNNNIITRCLINTGDSTQRYCSENKIKLLKVSCIILTSLSPHHISGLPGILLTLSSLGVGYITIIGPTGITPLIDIITPFTNRRYPEINIIQINGDDNDPKYIELEYMNIYIKPIWRGDRTGYPIAIAASIWPILKNRFCLLSTMSSTISIIPEDSTFSTYPSLNQLMKWSIQCCSKIILIVTLSTSSFSNNDIKNNIIPSNIIIGCKKLDFIGIYMSVINFYVIYLLLI
jgi:hypothetical protein